MNLLYIHYRKSLVGTISYNSLDKSYQLTYDNEWIKNGFEISPSLSFNGFDNQAVKNFIENLLPEGEGLEELSLYYQVSKSEKFAILKQIGLETTGALTFSSDKIKTIETSFRDISQKELEEKIKHRDRESIHIWDGIPRLSVAGVQSKLPLTILKDKIGFGEGDLCSTHILKFNRVGENVVVNEFISMKLAKALDFNVAEVVCLKMVKEVILLVKRFDRDIVDKSLIKRKHIIDSVQVLGLPVSYKYERNLGKNAPEYREGVSFKKLFSLADKAVVPILFKEQIIKWSILNLIIGNSDAHGKNISFFVDKDGLEVAPFYDIVNVTMYEGVYEQDMAMGIDDIFEFDKIDGYSITEFLEENNISIFVYFQEYKKTVIALDKVFNNSDFLEDEEILKSIEELLPQYIENVKKRVNNITNILNSVRYITPLENETNQEFFEENEKEIKRILGREYEKTNTTDDTVFKYILKIEKQYIKII